MKKELSTVKGTIAHALSNHMEELFDLINQDRYQDLQKRVDELLNAPELGNNSNVKEAQMIFKRCAHNKNLYYSTLITYLTGMKVGK